MGASWRLQLWRPTGAPAGGLGGESHHGRPEKFSAFAAAAAVDRRRCNTWSSPSPSLGGSLSPSPRSRPVIPPPSPSYEVLRSIGPGADPDGDALSAFDQSAYPAGLLLRQRRYFAHPEVLATPLPPPPGPGETYVAPPPLPVPPRVMPAASAALSRVGSMGSASASDAGPSGGGRSLGRKASFLGGTNRVPASLLVAAATTTSTSSPGASVTASKPGTPSVPPTVPPSPALPTLMEPVPGGGEGEEGRGDSEGGVLPATPAGWAPLPRPDRPFARPPPPAGRPGVPWKMVLAPHPSQHRALTKLRRRGCRSSRPALLASAAAAVSCWQPRAPYGVLLGWDIPSSVDFLWAVADHVGAFNSEQGGHLAPLMARTVSALAAAVMIQSLFRAHRARQLLQPSLCLRLLHRRAALCLQRAFRLRVMLARVSMLSRLRAYLATLHPTADTLCLSRAGAAKLATYSARGWAPFLFPEQRLRYAFDQRGSIFLCEDAGGAALQSVRPGGLPSWANVGLVRLTTMEVAMGGGYGIPLLDPRKEGVGMLLDPATGVAPMPCDENMPPPEGWTNEKAMLHTMASLAAGAGVKVDRDTAAQASGARARVREREGESEKRSWWFAIAMDGRGSASTPRAPHASGPSLRPSHLPLAPDRRIKITPDRPSTASPRPPRPAAAPPSSLSSRGTSRPRKGWSSGGAPGTGSGSTRIRRGRGRRGWSRPR